MASRNRCAKRSMWFHRRTGIPACPFFTVAKTGGNACSCFYNEHECFSCDSCARWLSPYRSGRTCAPAPAISPSPRAWRRSECGLCREAEKQPADAPVFFLKDINPRKPNRWLALPRAHHARARRNDAGGARSRFGPPPSKRRSALWGDQWGLAVNGDERRTQCHAHIHIGKLLEGVETPTISSIVDGPASIPIPTDGTGFWVHPVGGKLHVHLGRTDHRNRSAEVDLLWNYWKSPNSRRRRIRPFI